MIPFRDGTKPCVYEMDRIWERDSELAKDSDSPEKSSDRASSQGDLSVDYVSSESSLYDEKLVSSKDI